MQERREILDVIGCRNILRLLEFELFGSGRTLLRYLLPSWEEAGNTVVQFVGYRLEIMRPREMSGLGVEFGLSGGSILQIRIDSYVNLHPFPAQFDAAFNPT